MEWDDWKNWTNLEWADWLENLWSDDCDAHLLPKAAAALRNLHTENTALRVTDDNLRQELQECQDQRRAAFRRIEELDRELDAMRAQIGQGEPVGFALQMEASVIQAQKVLSDWNEWYGLNGGNAPLPPSGIVKAQEMLAEVRSLLASAPQAPQAAGLQHGPLACAQVVSMNDVQGVVEWLPHHGKPIKVGESLYSAPQQKPLTDEQDRALCEAYCNAASDEYFKARPQLDSDVNRRIFCAGHRKAWIEWQAAHNIGEKK